MQILILGGAGMLGHKLLQQLGARFDNVACTVRAPRASRLSRLPLFQGDHVIWGVDAFDWPALEALLRDRRPEVVVNALGIIKQRSASKDAVPSVQINSLLPHQLATLLGEWDGRLIHFSTDCVFSGRSGHYLESDAADAIDLYGRSKLLGEVTEGANAITLRSSIIGRELSHHHSLLDWFLAQNHRTVSGYRRVIYSGLTTIEMARVVGDVIEQHRSLHGLYHVAADAIAKLDLLALIKDAYHLDVAINPADDPVCDRSLNGGRFAAATGYRSPSWPELVGALAADPTPYAEWLQLLNHD